MPRITDNCEVTNGFAECVDPTITATEISCPLGFQLQIQDDNGFNDVDTLECNIDTKKWSANHTVTSCNSARCIKKYCMHPSSCGGCESQKYRITCQRGWGLHYVDSSDINNFKNYLFRSLDCDHDEKRWIAKNSVVYISDFEKGTLTTEYNVTVDFPETAFMFCGPMVCSTEPITAKKLWHDVHVYDLRTRTTAFVCEPEFNERIDDYDFFFEFRRAITPLGSDREIVIQVGEDDYQFLNISTINCYEDGFESSYMAYFFENGTKLETRKLACGIRKCKFPEEFDPSRGVCVMNTPKDFDEQCVLVKDEYNGTWLGEGSHAFDGSLYYRSTGQIFVRQSCTVKVYGGGTNLLLEKEYGTWNITGKYGEVEMCDPWSPLRPDTIECSCDKNIEIAPHSDSPVEYERSYESRYKSLPTKINSTYFFAENGMREGQSVSATVTASNTILFRFEFGSEIITIGFHASNGTIFTIKDDDENSRRNFKYFFNGNQYNARIVYNSNRLDIVMDGRYAFTIVPTETNSAPTKFTILGEVPDAILHDLFVFQPKQCKKDHVFSWRTASCMFVLPSEKCAELTNTKGETIWINSAFEPEEAPEGFDNAIAKVTVRDMCALYIYDNDEEHARFYHPRKGIPYWFGDQSTKVNEYGTTCTGAWHEAVKQAYKCYCSGEEVYFYDRMKYFDSEDEEIYTHEKEILKFGSFSVTTTPLEDKLKTGPFSKIKLMRGEDKEEIQSLFMYLCEDGLYFFEDAEKENYESRLVLGDVHTTLFIRNATGFEVRFNGKFAYFWQYADEGNITLLVEQMGKTIKTENGVRSEYNSPFEEAIQLPLGFYLYLSGIAYGDFSFTLSEYWNKSTTYELRISMNERKIQQDVYSGTEMITITSRTFSFAENTEFDVTFMSAPHALELYINGEIISPLAYYDPFVNNDIRMRYRKIKVKGNVKITDMENLRFKVLDYRLDLDQNYKVIL